MPNAAYDVCVIGGGPAGSVAAARLCQLGYKTLLIEKQRHPRFHIGESLLPRSREVFETLGLMEDLESRYIRKYAARFVDAESGRIKQYDFKDCFDSPYDYAFEVPRSDFDGLLFSHAKKLGAETRENFAVSEVLFQNGFASGVKGAGPEGDEEIGCRFVVDATGRDSFLANKIVGKEAIPELPQTAMFTHYENVWRQEGLFEGNIQILLYRHGWWWFIPFKGRVTSVGTVMWKDYSRGKLGKSNEAFMDETVANTPFAKEWLKDATRVAPVRHTADWSYRAKRLAGDGFALVGDAGIFLDPLFSTGVHLGMKGAVLLAETLDEGFKAGDLSTARFAEYESKVRKACGFFLTFVQGFYAGHFREMIVDEKQRATIGRLIVSVLSGDVWNDQARWISYLPDEYRPAWAKSVAFV